MQGLSFQDFLLCWSGGDACEFQSEALETCLGGCCVGFAQEVVE